MSQVSYIIVYEEGGELKTFTSADAERGLPPPSRGVQVVANKDSEVGRKLTYRAPFYWWIERDQKWRGGDLFGLIDWLLDSELVMLGRTLEDADFLKAKEIATSDPRLPAKSAIGRFEKDQADETIEE